jgi:hypothetical protein
MAVLVEAISVIIRSAAIEDRYMGGFDAFEAEIPNKTGCSDGELVRVGFMVPADVESYIRRLSEKGLCYLIDDAAQDIVVVDQQRGPLVRCDWIEAERVSLDPEGEQTITVAQLVNSQVEGLATPEGWDYAASLSRSFSFSADVQNPSAGMRFLRHENGLDVYWDDLAGKEVFVGRTR